MLYMHISIKSRVQVVFQQDHLNASYTYTYRLCVNQLRECLPIIFSNTYMLCVSQLKECLPTILRGERRIYLSNPAAKLSSKRPLNCNLFFFKHLQTSCESIKRVLANNPGRRVKKACLTQNLTFILSQLKMLYMHIFIKSRGRVVLQDMAFQAKSQKTT